MQDQVARVLEELGQHLEDADRHGAVYARRYAEHVFAGGPLPGKSHLHPCVAKLIREIVLDQRAERVVELRRRAA